MKKCIAVILVGLMAVSGIGCNKERDTIKVEETIEAPEVEFRDIFEIDNSDERLYKKIENINQDPMAINLYNKRMKEYPEYNINILSGLVYQMELYKDEPDRIYHTFFCTLPNTFFAEGEIESINEEYGLDMDINKWEEVSNEWRIGYYYLLTADEIKALADKGIKCYYVGSGEGDKNDVSIDTLEGIYEYCELYGDQYIQVK